MHHLAIVMSAPLVLSVSGCCCMGLPTGGAAPPPPAATAAASGSDALADLRSHLSAGESYGDGPGAAAVADHIRSRVSDYADGVAVRVMPGDPTRVVALVQCTDLADVDMGDRRGLVQLVVESVASDVPNADIGVAIQGQFLFGAGGLQRRGELGPRTWVGSTVSVADVQALFTPAAPGVGVAAVPPPVAPPAFLAPNADVVAELNELCGDTFCEGEYDYRFTTLTCDAALCTLAFEARQGATAPAETATVGFPAAGLRDSEGEPSEHLFETVGAALSTWEQSHARVRRRGR